MVIVWWWRLHDNGNDKSQDGLECVDNEDDVDSDNEVL